MNRTLKIDEQVVEKEFYFGRDGRERQRQRKREKPLGTSIGDKMCNNKKYILKKGIFCVPMCWDQRSKYQLEIRQEDKPINIMLARDYMSANRNKAATFENVDMENKD